HLKRAARMAICIPCSCAMIFGHVNGTSTIACCPPWCYFKLGEMPVLLGFAPCILPFKLLPKFKDSESVSPPFPLCPSSAHSSIVSSSFPLPPPRSPPSPAFPLS